MPDVVTNSNATKIINIRQLFKGISTEELIPITVTHDETHCHVSGWISNANFAAKRMVFILFINSKWCIIGR